MKFVVAKRKVLALAALGAGLILLPGEAEAQGLFREVYLNIPGQAVIDLTSSPNFPDNPSSTNIVEDFFESPSGFADNFGERLRGFIKPPITGEYVFWIASDDNSELWLSSDDQPTNAELIASVPQWTGSREWFAYPEQESIPIFLESGKIYYIEALHKEGNGGDNLAVRWQLPNGTVEEPIPASRLIPFGAEFTAPIITEQPRNVIVTEGQNAVFRVRIGNLDPANFQWQRNGQNIPGAVFAAYTNRVSQLSEDGDQFRVRVSNSLGSRFSTEAALFVVRDETRPEVTQVHNFGANEVRVIFSELMDAESLAEPGHYAIDPGISVSNAEPGEDGKTVFLETSDLMVGTQYTLTVNNVRDRAATPNTIAPNTRVDFIASDFEPSDIGDTEAPGVMTAVENGADVKVTGGSIADTEDRFQFSHEQRTGNFDVKIRLQSLEASNIFAQAGLMARENLEPDSRFAATMATPGISGAFFQWRQSTGGVSQVTGSAPVNYPETWLRLRRSGNQFTGFAGPDGNAWTRLGTVSISLTNTIYLGLAVSGQATNQMAQVEFRDFMDTGEIQEGGFLQSNVEPLGPSSRRTGLVISEIMYHPLENESGANLEYVELFNSQSVYEDISGYALEGSLDYVFPEGTILEAGGFLVVAADPAAVKEAYGIQNVIGGFNDNLPNNGGELRLHNHLGALLLQIDYSDDPPWPASADGAGHSLVLARPSYGEGSVHAWAASDVIGGSPGGPEFLASEPLRPVVINEFLAHTDEPEIDYLELYNHGNRAIDLSGAFLSDDPVERKFQIPDGRIIPAGGFAVFYQGELGFNLTSAGETIYFTNPDATRVIDSVRYAAQTNGIASGRWPDGADEFYELSVQTPGSPNGAPWFRDIVINEIMYHPISDNDGDEYVELYNKGNQDVDLGDWRFVDGIDFTFPQGTLIHAGAYLVVAKDKANLLAKYPQLDDDNTVGDYGGQLSNSGERIALAKPDDPSLPDQDFVIVDEVTYAEGGRWGIWADGGGSSLELIDAHSDNRRAANWADSDETGKSEWALVEHTGLLDQGMGAINELQAMLLNDGECLLDDVQVLSSGGAPLISNSGFEGGLSGWTMQGTHVRTGLATSGFQSGRSMHVRSSGGGDNSANRVETDLNSTLTPGTVATIRAHARWLRGSPLLLLRLHGNHLEVSKELPVPDNLGSPGLANSRRVENAGPAIYEVSHFPVLPQAGEPVRVTARAYDPDGLRTITLNYRFDPAVSATEVRMVDDGTSGDVVAGDGIYTAMIPGQAEGVLAAFYVRTRDDSAEPVMTTFPNDAPKRECLVRFGDSVPAGAFGTYRLWMTQANIDTWTNREVMSNDMVEGTVVYNDYRAIYNGGARYRGSPFIRPRVDSPTGVLMAYVWSVPKDDKLLGQQDFNLDSLEQEPNRDPTFQREKLAFWIHSQMDASFSHQRYVHVFVNGVKRGQVYTDSQQPNVEYVESWYFGDDDGEIFKVDDWFEFSDSPVSREFNVDATLEDFTTTGGVKKKARYRWSWEKRSNRGLDDDYGNFFGLVDAMNVSDPDVYTQAVENTIDVREWLTIFGIRHFDGDWDGYGYNRGKNMFLYKPRGERWRLMPWDLDISLGTGGDLSSDSPTHDLFDTNDPVIDRFYGNPPFHRLYLQILDKMIRGPVRMENLDPVMEANYAALRGNHIEVADTRSIKAYVTARVNYIQSVLATNTAPFEILTHEGNDFETADSLIDLEGTAPIRVNAIQINGIAYPVLWTTVTNWAVSVPVAAGVNPLRLTGADLDGKPVEGAEAEIDVTFTGEPQLPEDHLVINEIMYHPDLPDAEYIEIYNTSATQTFDLSHYTIDGVDFQFGEGVFILPRSFVLVVQDIQAFQQAYGNGLPVAGQYNGRLANGGETIRLLQPGPGDGVLIDEVTYSDLPPWSADADGLGASLQLVDPTRDNNRVGNWTAVHRDWQFVSVTGTAGDSSRITVQLNAPGSIYLDDFALVAGIVPRVGENLLENPGFESPLETGWEVSEAYTGSSISDQIHRTGESGLQLVAASDGADQGISQVVTPALTQGERYTLSYWYLPNASDVEVRVRLEGSDLSSQEITASESAVQATPGEANSTRTNLPEFPEVWINELLADNTSGIIDNAGERDPWVELLNAGGTAIDLSNYYLSDDYDHPLKWKFPAGTMIAAGEFKLVWLDGEADQSASEAPHASFRVSPSTGSLALSRVQNSRATLIDFLNYQSLASNRSFGSFPDADPFQRQVFQTPTPGAPNNNEATAIEVFINEWMAGNDTTLADPADGDFDDWFELYNAGDQAVALTGYTLSDKLDNPGKFVIPGGVAIPAKGFLLVWADEETGQNGFNEDLHVNFKLSRGGEAIGLYGPDGTIVDRVEFGPQNDDVSQGRSPDGASAPFMVFEQPTPGERNSGEPATGLEITGIRVENGAIRITWRSEPGKTYVVQFKNSLSDATWEILGDAIPSAGGETSALDDSASQTSARFYQIVEQ